MAQELDEIANELAVLAAQSQRPSNASKQEVKQVGSLTKQLRGLAEEISKHEEVRAELRRNIFDSDEFLRTLRSNLADLLAANEAQGVIGEIAFTYCPLCLSSLSAAEDSRCSLCGSELSGGIPSRGRLRHEQELKHQIRESERLAKERCAELAQIDAVLTEATSKRNALLTQLRDLVAPQTNVDARVADLLRRQGYLNRKVEDLNRLQKLQVELDALESEVQKLAARVDSLERDLSRREQSQRERKEFCNKRIAELTMEILRQDIIDGEHTTLRDAEGFVFSFEKDFLSVRHGRLAASTQVFLKSSFQLALLKFAVEDAGCRIPNFLLLDNVEDKGMVPERFRRFHDLLIKFSGSADVQHQVILTTSNIAPELEGSGYCVGPSYDRPPFTLDLSGEWANRRG